jgi:organic hydroperoxide reductase OsmC/OhrA
MEFLGLELLAEGQLGKPEGKLRFTEIVLKPTLDIAQREDLELENRLLEKAEQGCLIARSLVCPVHLEPLVRHAEQVLTP